MAKTNKTILIVEDERALLEAISAKLQKSGYETLSARSVDQAIEYLGAVKRVDAVWLDHYLPRKMGTELIVFMKKDGSPYRNIPIFLVSNTASAGNVYNYMHLGVNKYYVKAEHRLDEIINEIKSFLDHPKE